MPTVPARAPVRKPERCLSCQGTGLVVVSGCFTKCCPGCDGVGYPRPAEPQEEYVATQVEAVIDRGGPLKDFVADFLKSWSEIEDEEVIIWRVVEGRGPRAVAVIRPDGRGDVSVRWL